ncbi:unnamed protein product [Trichogramma brassicae]|uniref:Uncharacterized protein n=1 Tax=Trichogramma brassicae TaxID=86971 RepID=A0A6H5JAG9_9HYME|nr:unnamed protein product [Trichogramma brassicae]
MSVQGGSAASQKWATHGLKNAPRRPSMSKLASSAICQSTREARWTLGRAMLSSIFGAARRKPKKPSFTSSDEQLLQGKEKPYVERRTAREVERRTAPSRRRKAVTSSDALLSENDEVERRTAPSRKGKTLTSSDAQLLRKQQTNLCIGRYIRSSGRRKQAYSRKPTITATQARPEHCRNLPPLPRNRPIHEPKIKAVEADNQIHGGACRQDRLTGKSQDQRKRAADRHSNAIKTRLKLSNFQIIVTRIVTLGALNLASIATTVTSASLTYSTSAITSTTTSSAANSSTSLVTSHSLAASNTVNSTQTTTPSYASPCTSNNEHWLPLLKLLDQRLEKRFSWLEPYLRHIDDRQKELEATVQALRVEHERLIAQLSSQIRSLSELISPSNAGSAGLSHPDDIDSFEVRYSGLRLSAPVNLETIYRRPSIFAVVRDLKNLANTESANK